MPRNEEGEYELVLGTPQLLSIIFVVVVLFGVVFSLGYFVGRGAAPQPAAANAGAATAGGASQARPEPAGQRATPPVTVPETGGEKAAQTAPVGGPPAAQEAPATSATATAPPASQPAAAPASSVAETKPAAAQPGASAQGAPYAEPAPGQTFLQVAAVRRIEAEALVDVLKKKGFSAIIAPGPSETLFRVLVGPLKDAEEIASTRKALEEAGFRSAYVRKY